MSATENHFSQSLAVHWRKPGRYLRVVQPSPGYHSAVLQSQVSHTPRGTVSLGCRDQEVGAQSDIPELLCKSGHQKESVCSFLSLAWELSTLSRHLKKQANLGVSGPMPSLQLLPGEVLVLGSLSGHQACIWYIYTHVGKALTEKKSSKCLGFLKKSAVS